jgi:hypothetical protein
MEYKTGDKVKIKNLDWFNTNRCGGPVICDGFVFLEFMSEYCGKELTIDYIYTDSNGKQAYVMKETNAAWRFTDSMIEGLAEEEPEEKMVSLNKVCEQLKNTIDDDVLVKRGSVIDCMDIDDFVLYFRKIMEE